MIDGIISGVLVLPPKRLFTRRASPYVIGKIDVMAVRQDGQPVHGNVIAFDAGVCTALLAMAMAALGLTTYASALRQAGPRPMLLAALLFGWLLGGGMLINLGVRTLVP